MNGGYISLPNLTPTLFPSSSSSKSSPQVVLPSDRAEQINKMVVSFKVFKKSSPNGKIIVYLAKRDFVDNISCVEPIDGVIVIDQDYLHDRKIFGQLVCSFRYGREEDEVMGLKFQKDLHLASEQIYPPGASKPVPSKLQERLMKKLGPNAFPFTFKFPPNSPASVTLQPGPEDQGRPCGVEYFLKAFAGETDADRSHKRYNNKL